MTHRHSGGCPGDTLRSTDAPIVRGGTRGDEEALEARDRRPMRPVPGDRSSWSHGPIARVHQRPGMTTTTSTRPDQAPVAPGRPVLPFAPVGLPAPTGRGGVPVMGGMRAVGPGQARHASPPPRTGFGLPSIRRNVCPHFYLGGVRGAIPIQAPHLLKGLIRQSSAVSRCQVRGGVHMDEGYVNDVCLTPRFNQCVFSEDELAHA